MLILAYANIGLLHESNLQLSKELTRKCIQVKNSLPTMYYRHFHKIDKSGRSVFIREATIYHYRPIATLVFLVQWLPACIFSHLQFQISEVCV